MRFFVTVDFFFSSSQRLCALSLKGLKWLFFYYQLTLHIYTQRFLFTEKQQQHQNDFLLRCFLTLFQNNNIDDNNTGFRNGLYLEENNNSFLVRASFLPFINIFLFKNDTNLWTNNKDSSFFTNNVQTDGNIRQRALPSEKKSAMTGNAIYCHRKEILSRNRKKKEHIVAKKELFLSK